MTTTKRIELKGLTSEERERRLFDALEPLRTGDCLQVVLEFNPLALAYALKAGGEFRLEYLKQGPEAWVLELIRAAQPAEKREQLKELLRQARKGPLSPEGREQARSLLGVLDVTTLALLERELAREGLNQADIRGLLGGLHEQVVGDSLGTRGGEPAGGKHPVRRLLEEHQAILGILDLLEEAVGQLAAAPTREAAREPVERLRRAAGLLQQAESHHRREEQVIFPRLERLGIAEPPALMRQDHERFHRRSRRLAALAEQGAAEGGDFGLWRCEVVDHGQSLVRELASHILKEDHVLYRQALQAFEAAEWEQVRRESDALGYCRFDPEPSPGRR
jgi:DUF438 domain-containing protein